MKKLFSILAIAALFAGCAGTPQEKAANKLQEMQEEKAELLKKASLQALALANPRTNRSLTTRQT